MQKKMIALAMAGLAASTYPGAWEPSFAVTPNRPNPGKSTGTAAAKRAAKKRRNRK